MNVIGVTGFAGSGKSTVAQYLVEAHGYTRLSLAGPLKQMLRTLDPMLVSESGMANWRLSDLLEIHKGGELAIKASPFGKEYRRLLQVLGTDCIRSIDPEFWIKAAEKNLTDTNGKYVFDDVRFPNEADLITKYSYWGLWTVERPGYEAVNGHASEQHAGQMGECLMLWNTDLPSLHDQIDHAVETAFSEVDA